MPEAIPLNLRSLAADTASMNTDQKHAPVFADQLIEFHVVLYQQALENGDRDGRLESAGILSLAFAAKGNSIMARKWAESFFEDLPAVTTGPLALRIPFVQ
ncbi:MAG: hypothetical protein WCN95_09620 [bacterium]